MKLCKYTAGLVFLVFSIQTVHAECYVCDDKVEITEQAKVCFLNSIDRHRTRLANDIRPKIYFNLLGCETAENDGSRAVVKMPNLFESNASASQIRSNYLLDSERLECLHDLLLDIDEVINPFIRLDLRKQCTN